ncbi:hypothetical protein [Streptomyces violaceusniger]|uniref:Uncharacterized protein n=1 Tax=Streptomyces violaceusniger (strain Tu 4113) TaxID=653045 RepID=G2PHP1_STRV4|nr:hypothetical protein [Streptomyces violaceusniger]AEM88842.1 hypothetical protein Strvi_0066 [Streptomyces violaceusniger Tu 4113]
MAKRRQYTRELLSARAESVTAHTEGRGPLLRIVAGWGGESGAMPVQYAPRSKGDPRPWVQWNQHDGSEGFRFTGRDCWAQPVTDDNAAPEFWAVERTILTRLAARGIAMVQERGQDWSYLSYVFADGSAVVVYGGDVNGLAENSVRHTVGEHGRLSWHWMSANGTREREGEIPEGEQGADFGRDSVALIMAVTTLAARHGRAWQQDARDDLNAAAHQWAQENGAELPFPPAADDGPAPVPVAEAEPAPEADKCGAEFVHGGRSYACTRSPQHAPPCSHAAPVPVPVRA